MRVAGDAVSYLALGTSLAVGFQPGQAKTDRGIRRRPVAADGRADPGLTLRNVGCPGETSRSMINGMHSLCHYAAGSQLDAAVAFLEAHPGQVAFITIDVGANDLLDGCLEGHPPDRPGMRDRPLPRLQGRLTHIVDDARRGRTERADRRDDVLRPVPRVLGFGPGRSRLARADQRAWTRAQREARDRVRGRRAPPSPTWRPPSGSTTSRTPSWSPAAVGSP